jgi:hypothetical protein
VHFSWFGEILLPLIHYHHLPSFHHTSDASLTSGSRILKNWHARLSLFPTFKLADKFPGEMSPSLVLTVPQFTDS